MGRRGKRQKGGGSLEGHLTAAASGLRRNTLARLSAEVNSSGHRRVRANTRSHVYIHAEKVQTK